MNDSKRMIDDAEILKGSSIYSPEVDAFLAHYGVPGMKWGVKRNLDTPSSSRSKTKSSSTISKQDLRAASLKASKLVLKYGAVPAAVFAATSVGMPHIAALSITTRILQDPMVREVTIPATKFVRSVASEFGSVKLSDLPKVKDPFSKVSINRASSGIPKPTLRQLKMLKDGGEIPKTLLSGSSED